MDLDEEGIHENPIRVVNAAVNRLSDSIFSIAYPWFLTTAYTDEVDAMLTAANGWVSEDNVSAFLCG
ncbi:hypothetical protein [Paenibacillus sp. Root444D2]|uniref:hypothetical protein n=1 Tax=Paenibacillus sp. Root444D2 TaxID=1736538 RepID=UPI00070C43BC|nr:hypothetical protein [Paenibacillus sp. Root444D2]KQX55280.1 hypothetical protein ASD40_33405 [Paenibacillus sp. Root444D2]